MKVTFINEMADLCEKVGADVHDVARGIGLDGRIGRKFLHPGPGFGGSCFPKDTLALVRIAQDAGAPSRLVETVVAVNDARKAGMAMRVIAACGGSVRGKTIAVLGLTFKPETDDMRDSPSSRKSSPALVEDGRRGAGVRPRGDGRSAQDVVRRGVLRMRLRHAAADACTVLTEWNEFRALDLERVKSLLKSPVMVDLRNIYNPSEMVAAGFRYSSIWPSRRCGRRVDGSGRRVRGRSPHRLVGKLSSWRARHSAPT